MMRLHSFRTKLSWFNGRGIPIFYHGSMEANFVREMRRFHGFPDA